MVCEKCEAKLAKIVTPDPWKSGARNTTEGDSHHISCFSNHFYIQFKKKQEVEK